MSHTEVAHLKLVDIYEPYIFFTGANPKAGLHCLEMKTCPEFRTVYFSSCRFQRMFQPVWITLNLQLSLSLSQV